ncbi:hypothetical protein ACI2KS_22075 [Pseudomonas sp. NPDC087358]|uniref:hypothetical protein n=1 Tax=Pseudomonas sp. NPDC087358 TaxID=3364439 RepID=UPI00384E39B9
MGANSVAANGQPERGLASDGSDKTGASRVAADKWDRMKVRELAGELCYECLTR